MKTLSTLQVAAKVGVDRVTLERWISARKVKLPKTVTIGSRQFRLWTESDVERIRRFKEQNYCKGRGRKPRKAPRR